MNLTDYSPWLLLWLPLLGLLVGIAWTAISIPLGVFIGRLFARQEQP